MELIERTLAPQLIGRDGAEIEAIWRDLFFLTHATTVGAITSLALAAIDTALWDLRCRARRPAAPRRWPAARRRSVPLYTTEGGWLHISRPRRWSRTRCRPRPPASAAPRSRSAGRSTRTCARLAAVREAVGARLRDHDRRQPGASPSTRRSAARALYEPFDIAWFEEPLPADDLDGHVRLVRARPRCRSRSARASTACRISANICSATPARSCRSTSPGSAASRPG